VLVFLLACTPTCKDVCTKLAECPSVQAEGITEAECTESCSTQQDLYAEWSDVEKRKAFDAELTCLYESDCDEVAADACYDERIFAN
jgi:hypothetical protein